MASTDIDDEFNERYAPAETKLNELVATYGKELTPESLESIKLFYNSNRDKNAFKHAFEKGMIENKNKEFIHLPEELKNNISSYLEANPPFVTFKPADQTLGGSRKKQNKQKNKKKTKTKTKQTKTTKNKKQNKQKTNKKQTNKKQTKTTTKQTKNKKQKTKNKKTNLKIL